MLRKAVYQVAEELIELSGVHLPNFPVDFTKLRPTVKATSRLGTLAKHLAMAALA